MKSNPQLNSINNKASNAQERIEKMQHEAKQRLFNLLYVLLKDTNINLWFELICLAFQTIQLLAFALHPIFVSVWKGKSVYMEISNILQYSILTYRNKEVLLIAFCFFFLLVIFLYFVFIYLAYSFSHSKSRCSSLGWIVLKASLGCFVSTMYLPIINTFLFVFNCVNSDWSDIELVQCWSGEFVVCCVFGVIGAGLFFGFALLFSMTYIETRFSGNNLLAKSTTHPDVCLLVIKTLLVVVFVFFGNEHCIWLAIISIAIASGYIAFMFYDIKPYYNCVISKAYNVMCALFVWSGVVLIIGKLLRASHYDGSLGLFLIGIPIIILTIYFNEDKILFKLLSSIGNIHKGETYLEQIKTFLKLIKERNNNRKARIELKGYIIQYEEKCILSDCPLKKYLASALVKNTDVLIFLLQHAEGMYQCAITKYPSCVSLRCSYAFFLLDQMNKTRQSALELISGEKYNPTLEEQFVIFRYRKFIEERSFEHNEPLSSSFPLLQPPITFSTQMDVVSSLAYKNYLTQFKNAIRKASGLYIDFWSLLLNRDPDNYNDLTKLNDYGTDINSAVENIHDFFTKMQKIKLIDQEVIKHYSDFLNDILNDKDKASYYKSKLYSFNDEEKEVFEEFNPVTHELTTLSINDEYQYVVASAQTEKFGIMINISLGICSLFGYTKHELIGKPIDIIMPDIFHKGHKEVLFSKLNDFKKKSVESNKASKPFKPSYREIETFGKNKSRYLIPLTLKTSFVATENNDLIFVAKLWKDQSLFSIYSPHQSSFILTNTAFIIQTFTVNALTLLNMRSSAINGNVDITEFIKQFHEEFLFQMLENESNSHEKKVMMKKTIASNRFKAASMINWRHYNDQFEIKKQPCNDSVSDHNIKNFSNKDATDSIVSIKRVAKNKDDCFILTITDIFINNKQEGYLFRLDIANINCAINLLAPKGMQLGLLNSKSTSSKHFSSFNMISDYKQKHMHYTTSFLTQEKATLSDESIFSKARIDQFYIPEKNENVQFDLKSYSFKINSLAQIELREQLKKEAYRIIHKQTNQLNKRSDVSSSSFDDCDYQDIDRGKYDEDNTNEEESDEEGDDSNEDYSSNSVSNNNQWTIDTVVRPSRTSGSVIRQKNDEMYYKVNMNHMKYSIYDYSKQMIVEIKDYDKTDQVQLKLTHHSSENDSSLHIKSTQRDNNSQNMLNVPLSNNHLLNATELHDQKTKEASLIKKIEYALSKEENQPSITKMKLICFIVFIILLSFLSGSLGLLLSSFALITENVILIEKAFDLIYFNAFGIYNVRELTLVNNKDYTSLPEEREKYIARLFNETQKMFSTSNDLLNYIITSSLKLSLNASLEIYNNSFCSAVSEETEDYFEIRFFNLSSVITFLQTNTALFHIGHTRLSEIIPMNKDVFYYLYNSLNGIPIALKAQGLVLLKELERNAQLIKRDVLLFWFSMLIVLIGIYFLLANAYDGIARRKESYLEVFFEIGRSVIKRSLDKCENFIKKLQIENINDDLSIENYDYVIISNGNKNKNSNNRKSISNKMHESNTVNSVLHNMKSHRSRMRNSNARSSREAKVVKAKFVVFLFVNGVFTMLSFIFYLLFLIKVAILIKVYSYMTEQHNEYLMLFNGLREFMFDSNAIVDWKEAIAYIDDILDRLYYFNRDQSEFIQLNIQLASSNFASIYRKVFKESACLEGNRNYYSTLHQCESIMSKSSIYGLEIALMYFTEEIRAAKNFAIDFKKNQTKTGQRYNLTLTGTTQGDRLWPNEDEDKLEEYKANDSILQFLRGDIHFNINIMLVLVLIPNFEKLSLMLKDDYALSIRTVKLVYVIVFAVFLGLIVSVYLVLWLPYEKRINQTIYKTKNMLSIIPKEVLASLSNIHRILNISTKSPIGPQVIKPVS